MPRERTIFFAVILISTSLFSDDVPQVARSKDILPGGQRWHEWSCYQDPTVPAISNQSSSASLDHPPSGRSSPACTPASIPVIRSVSADYLSSVSTHDTDRKTTMSVESTKSRSSGNQLSSLSYKTPSPTACEAVATPTLPNSVEPSTVDEEEEEGILRLVVATGTTG